MQIKNKSGMFTKGGKNDAILSIKDKWFETASENLKSGTFKFSNKRRVFISKKVNDKRSFTISDSKVKIIERALLNVLEPIYEGSYILCKCQVDVHQMNIMKVFSEIVVMHIAPINRLIKLYILLNIFGSTLVIC